MRRSKLDDFLDQAKTVGRVCVLLEVVDRNNGAGWKRRQEPASRFARSEQFKGASRSAFRLVRSKTRNDRM